MSELDELIASFKTSCKQPTEAAEVGDFSSPINFISQFYKKEQQYNSKLLNQIHRITFFLN